MNLITNENGIKAPTIAIEYKPDLILPDLNRPDVHGREVLTVLKSDEKNRAIPFVVISAEAMPQRIESLRTGRARNYLTKPMDLSILLKIIDGYIV